MLGAPVAGSQVLQHCHQQRSVEAVAIPCKVALLLSALKVLCTACISSILQVGQGCFFHVSVSTGTEQHVALRGSAKRGLLVMQLLHAVGNMYMATGQLFIGICCLRADVGTRGRLEGSCRHSSRRCKFHPATDKHRAC